MGYRVIVPPHGQQRVLVKLHAGHPGVARMKDLARTIVWWPERDRDIERKVQGCSSCQETRNAQQKAPLLASLVLASSAVDERAHGLRWTLARKKCFLYSLTHTQSGLK